MAELNPDERAALRQLAAAKKPERFRRTQLAPGVLMTSFLLQKGERSSRRCHVASRDTFHVVVGRVTVTLEVPPGSGDLPYHAVGAERPVITSREDGVQLHAVRLSPGEVLVVESNIAHHASNDEDAACSFLCIEAARSTGTLSAQLDAHPHALVG